MPCNGTESREREIAVVKILCVLIGHRRSRRDAKRNPETADYESVCTRCGEALVRIAHNDWRAANGQDDDPLLRHRRR